MRYVRWTFGAIAIGAFVFILYQTLFGAPLTCTKCNVILISLDTVGINHTTLGGAAPEVTPFLATLAQKNISFVSAYSQAPWTLPSHTAMFTGLYPWDLNVWFPGNVLPDTALTVAEMLAGQGYQTAAFSDGAFVRPAWHFDQGFQEFHGDTAESAWNDVPKIFTDASSWINKRDTARPFFLLIRPFEAHDPYQVGNSEIGIREIAAANLAPGGPTEAEAERFRTAQLSEIQKIDAALKELFDSLSKQGLLRNTIVIITADHGEEFGEHGTVGFHTISVHRELLRVPLVVVTPSGVRRTVSESVEVRSIPATILDFLGIAADPAMATSLLPLVERSEQGDRVALSITGFNRTLLNQVKNGYPPEPEAKLFENTVRYEGPRTISAIKGKWHVISDESGIHIYDMDSDPLEAHDLNTTASILQLDHEVIDSLTTQVKQLDAQ